MIFVWIWTLFLFLLFFTQPSSFGFLGGRRRVFQQLYCNLGFSAFKLVKALKGTRFIVKLGDILSRHQPGSVKRCPRRRPDIFPYVDLSFRSSSGSANKRPCGCVWRPGPVADFQCGSVMEFINVRASCLTAVGSVGIEWFRRGVTLVSLVELTCPG